MALYSDSKRDWDRFSNGDWEAQIDPDANICGGCDGPLDQQGHCQACEEPAQGRHEALRAAAHHWANKARAA